MPPPELDSIQSLPTDQRLHQRPDLDRAAGAGRHLDGGVQVVGLEQIVAAERFLGLRKRPVRGQRGSQIRTRTVVAIAAGWSRW
jgi:hypothetical protein